MTIIISYILGIVTVFLIGVAVGIFWVVNKNNKLSKEIDSINLELSLLSKDLYGQIEMNVNDLNRTIRDIHSTMDSRFDRFENKIVTRASNKNLIVD